MSALGVAVGGGAPHAVDLTPLVFWRGRRRPVEGRRVALPGGPAVPLGAPPPPHPLLEGKQGREALPGIGPSL